jgi:hypothetical protein
MDVTTNEGNPWYYIPPSLSLDAPASRTAIDLAAHAEILRTMAMAPFGENSDAAFQPWTADQQHAPKCWDVKRLLAVPTPERREKAWRAKRRHAPCSNRIPPEWGLDCIYLRYREEAGYAQRLSSLLQHPPQMALEGVSLELVCLERPLLPFRWPRLSRPTGDPVREFPVQGSLQIPGEDVPRDSAYALFRSSGLGGLGDPGRFIREFKREKRDRRRNFLVSWSQVEFFDIPTAARAGLYPHLPEWWAGVEVSTSMSVPLPPIVTYHGSGLIRGDALSWAIFRSEWAVLVFGRWCADLYYRGVMWRMRPQLRAWIEDLGVTALLEGSGFDATLIRRALEQHDLRDWPLRENNDERDIEAVAGSCIKGEFSVKEPRAESTREYLASVHREPVNEHQWPDNMDPYSPVKQRVSEVPAVTPLRSAPAPELREPVPNTAAPNWASRTETMGPLPAEGGGEIEEVLRQVGTMEVGVWEELWSYARGGRMDAGVVAAALRGMFLSMQAQAARADRRTRERDELLRERDESGFSRSLRAARLRTLAKELEKEADSLSGVEPRVEDERPSKRARYED